MPLGGIIHGHLALAMTSDKYTTTTDTTATADFVFPVNPTTSPVHSYTSTTSQITETIRLHKKKCRAFQLYHNVDTALRNQLITSNPITLLQDLQDTILGLGQVTCSQRLMKLRVTYGKITQTELD